MPKERERASVLLVEDDRDYSQLLREAFMDAGFRTLHADNGERALEILRKEPIDLVVSDFIMPELNGLELCRLVAQDIRLSKLKVILYSCNEDNTFRTKARELGALEYLPKTDDTEQLVRAVCELSGLDAAPAAAAPAATTGTGPDSEQRLRLVAQSAGQLKVLFGNMLDFGRILALSGEQTPASELAWEAMQRTGTDIQKVLTELEAVPANSSPQA